jgi:hypothetical protein
VTFKEFNINLSKSVAPFVSLSSHELLPVVIFSVEGAILLKRKFLSLSSRTEGKMCSYTFFTSPQFSFFLLKIDF